MKTNAARGTPRFFRALQGKGPLKLTALLYLREALLDERYEECAELVTLALEFGARPAEVTYLLEDPRREVKN